MPRRFLSEVALIGFVSFVDFFNPLSSDSLLRARLASPVELDRQALSSRFPIRSGLDDTIPVIVLLSCVEILFCRRYVSSPHVGISSPPSDRFPVAKFLQRLLPPLTVSALRFGRLILFLTLPGARPWGIFSLRMSDLMVSRL